MYNFVMYILELLAKIITEKKTKNTQKTPVVTESEYEDTCSHVFLPVDSTGKILACSKCGLIVKNDSSQYKPKNPFS